MTIIYGQMRLREHRAGNLVRASIIQGNIEQDRKWEPLYQDAVLATYKDLSLKATASSPSIIVWPETAVPFFFMADTSYSRELVAFQDN